MTTTTFQIVQKFDVRVVVGRDYLIVGTATLVDIVDGTETWAADDSISDTRIGEFGSAAEAIAEIEEFAQTRYFDRVDVTALTSRDEALRAFGDYC